MELNVKVIKLVLHSFLLLLLQELSAAVEDDVRSSCRTAPNDLVFILDGSFSVGPKDFEIVKNWIVNISSSFEIGTTFTKVGVIQYSDHPLLEIALDKHRSNEDLMKAMDAILYRGGNTRTGKAITFGVNNVFATSTRAANAVTKVAIVLTDGKSQDDVKHSAEEARRNKIILFAIGVGQEIEDAELQAIANKPSSTYVFHVKDYTGISRIREIMKQKLCEETVCPTRIPVASRDEKGFDILVGLDIRKKASKIQGSYSRKKAYSVTPQSDLTDKTRDIFPDGLPPSYVFVSTLRLKRPATKEKWDLWRILALDGTIQTAITLNGEDNTVVFYTTHMMNETQSVTFTSPLIKALFDENWHLLRVLVTERDVTLYLDDKLVETRQLEPVLGIFVSGRTQIGKYFGKEATVPFEVQKLRIYCDPEQNQRENACEIPAVCDSSLDDVSSTPPPCTCTPGPAGPQGLKGEHGAPGEHGNPGSPGADGKPGTRGLPGSPGIPGLQGIQGLRGFHGYKGEQGRPGVPGERGVPGFQGLPGPQGSMGSKGFKGEQGLHGFEGKKGVKGDRGSHGYPGLRGPPGHQGENGKNGLPGIPGIKGEPGTVGFPGLDGIAGLPGIPGMPGHIGPMGHKGRNGITGEVGERGPSGKMGEMGLPGGPGSRGLPGYKGNKGERGIQGIQGQYGNKGHKGEPGLPGQPGHSGMPGMKGIKGDLGNTGAKGNQGDSGRTGARGMPGLQGAKGSEGSKGEPGEPGALGTAGIRGQKGEPGIPGRTGHSGPKGNNGLSGQPGPPGPEGISGSVISDEYIRQVCMDVLRTQLPSVLRNQRNQNCWHCQSHQGSSGSPGPPGIQGPPGFPGLDGEQGQPGHIGLPGLPGIQGLMGFPGEKGEKGDRGIGSPGRHGLPGPPGSMGSPGISKSGYPGKPGTPGKVGVPGKSGRAGPPGPPGICQPSLCYGAIAGRDPFRKGPNY